MDIALIAAVGKYLKQQLLEIAAVELFAQGVEHPCVVYIQQRVAAVEPAVESSYRKLDAVGLGDLAAAEGKALDACAQSRAVKPVLCKLLCKLRNAAADGPVVFHEGVEHDKRHGRLEYAVADLHAHVLRKPRFEDIALERSLVGAGEVVCEYLRGIDLFYLVK